MEYRLAAKGFECEGTGFHSVLDCASQETDKAIDALLAESGLVLPPSPNSGNHRFHVRGGGFNG